VQNAFERLIPQGTQVPYFLYLTVPPAEIDVNIHPTKTEIKFENELGIFQILSTAVRDAVGRFCNLTTIDFDQEGAPDIPAFDPSHHVSIPQPQYNPAYNPFRQSGQMERSRPAEKDWQEIFFPAPDDSRDSVPAETPLADRSSLHYQYKGQYILTALASGLMVTDQHRADLRVRYEQFMRSLASQTSATQRLLFPEVLECTPSEAVLMEQLLPELERMGFDITPLGQGSFALSGIPAGIDCANEMQLVRDVVAEAALHEGSLGESLHAVIATSLARSTAIPEGQLLNNDEMEHLVAALLSCQNANYTPDGKPISHIIADSELCNL
jgi:DNA mismatch repair protein MutL